MSTASLNSVDVFVAGGGPAGLATAIAARRHGLSVLVADGAVPPIDKACGEGLMPDGVEALRALGITLPEGEAQPFRGIRFISGNKKAEAVFPRGTAYGIRRTTLHRIMVEHAQASGVSLRWQAAVTGLHPEGALACRRPGARALGSGCGRCSIAGAPLGKTRRAPAQERSFRVSSPLPHPALDRFHGTALGRTLPALRHRRWAPRKFVWR